MDMTIEVLLDTYYEQYDKDEDTTFLCRKTDNQILIAEDVHGNNHMLELINITGDMILIFPGDPEKGPILAVKYHSDTLLDIQRYTFVPEDHTLNKATAVARLEEIGFKETDTYRGSGICYRHEEGTDADANGATIHLVDWDGSDEQILVSADLAMERISRKNFKAWLNSTKPTMTNLLDFVFQWVDDHYLDKDLLDLKNKPKTEA